MVFPINTLSAESQQRLYPLFDEYAREVEANELWALMPHAAASQVYMYDPGATDQRALVYALYFVDSLRHAAMRNRDEEYGEEGAELEFPEDKQELRELTGARANDYWNREARLVRRGWRGLLRRLTFRAPSLYRFTVEELVEVHNIVEEGKRDNCRPH